MVLCDRKPLAGCRHLCTADGDITPSTANNTEMLFTTLVEFLGLFVFSYTVSNMAELVGNLNAKSDQLDLLPLSPELTDDMEIGGRFLGLQDFSLAGWEAPRLTNPGGRLDLSRSCAVSESAPIRALW